MPACPPLPVGGFADVPNRQTLLNVDIVVQCEFICCTSSSTVVSSTVVVSSSLLNLLCVIVVVRCAFGVCWFCTNSEGGN